MVESTAKLREEILAISGVDIMENANEFKSTYKIMDELSAKWEGLTDIQQATVTELIAGKRQGNIISSLMTNFDTARSALETSLNSAGSAMQEHEKWQQSLEARINNLKASWQGLSQAFLSSDFLKFALDSVTGLVDVLTKLVDTFGALGIAGIALVGKGIWNHFRKGKKSVTDVANAIEELTEIIKRNAEATNESANASERNAVAEQKEATATAGSAAVETVENEANKQAVASELAEAAANKNSADSEAKEVTASTASATAEFAENEVNKQAVASELAEAAANKNSADSEAKEALASATSATAEFADASSNAASGAAELGGAIANIGKNAKGAATGGLKALLSKLGGFITSHPYLTIAIAAVTALTAAFMYQRKKAEELAEEVSELTEKYKEEHNELKNFEHNLDTTNESSMISRYEKLSRGVDNLGRNVSLTAEEYSEYQSIVNNIADQIPSLVSGYDEQGNALLSCKGNVEALTEAYQKLIHAQNQEILTNTGNIDKDFANTLESASGKGAWSNNHGFWAGLVEWITFNHGGILGQIDKNYSSLASRWFDYELKDDTIQGIEGLLNAKSNSEKDAILKKLEADRYATEEIRDALTSAGVDMKFFDDPLEVLEKTLEDDPQKVKNIIGDYYERFAEAVEEQKTVAQAVLSEAFDVSDVISGLNYGNISEDLQAVAYQTISSLDLDFFKELQNSDKTVEQWTTEMLDQLNSINKKDNAKIEAAFDLQTKFNGGEISYGEYVEGLESTGKIIERLNLKPELESQLKLSLGLDEDGLVEGYDKLKKRLADSTEFNIMPSEYESFLKGLSSEEVSVLWEVIPELEATDYKESISDVKAALEKEMMLQGLTFDLNIEVEAAGIESLNTALAESVSGSGLSAESIAALEARYADLELQGYDVSAMFENTSHGIHLNREEFNKLEKELSSQKIAEIDGDLKDMKDTYDKLGEQIRACDDPVRKSELFSERQLLGQRIAEAAELATQYKGLTSAYNDWLAAEESGSERSMYEQVLSGWETVGDEISRGWYDDGTVKFLELVTGRTDLATKSAKELKQVWKDTDKNIQHTTYSVRDFFTVDEDGNSTSQGVYNFLDAIGQMEEEKFAGKDVIKRDSKGNIIEFDFQVAGGDKAIADALGISEELVQIMKRAAEDAGFVVSLDGTYKEYTVLENEARAAAQTLRELSKENEKLKNAGGDFQFDFDTTSITSLEEDLKQANKILDTFKDKDGNIDLKAEGAIEAMQIVSTLQARLDDLQSEQYGIGLTVEDEEFEEPLANLQEYGRTVAELNQLKINPNVNSERIEQLEGELDSIAEEFNNLPDQKKIELGLVGEDGKTPLNNIEDIKKQIESGEVKIPTVLDIQANMDKNLEDLKKIALLGSGLLSDEQEEKIKLEILADVEVKANEVDDSDVKEKVDETVTTSTSSKTAVKTVDTDVKVKTEKVDTSDVDEKVDEAVNGETKIKDIELQVTTGLIVEQANDIELAELIKDYSPIKQKVIVEYFVEHSEVDKYTPEQKKALVEFIANSDSLDSYTPEEKQAIVEYLTDSSDPDNWTPAQKEAVAKFIRESSDVDSYTPAQKEAIAKFIRDSVDPDTYTPPSPTSTVTFNKNTTDVDNYDPPNFTRYVTYYAKKAFSTAAEKGKKALENRFGIVNGTANSDGSAFVGGTGRAFRQGDWRTKRTETALTGELGREIVVTPQNRWYTVGDNGAEFVNIPRGSIVFNHRQTEELLRNGKATSDGGRAKALVNGTAFLGGTAHSGVGEWVAPEVQSFKVGYNYGNKDSDNLQEIVDWIEVAIERIEREIDNLDKKANDVYKSWDSRNSALADQIGMVSNEIELQQEAYDGYMSAANQVGLSSEWEKKVQSGAIDIDTITDEALKEKIGDYQEWYEKALDCKDAIIELQETEASLYAQRVEEAASKYEGVLGVIEHERNILEEYISQNEANAQLVSAEYYSALIGNENKTIAELQNQKNDMLAELQKAMKAKNEDGTPVVTEGSEGWYEMVNQIDEVTLAIAESQTQIKEWNQVIQQLSWETFDMLQEKISAVTEEADFLIELMSSDKLHDDNGDLTDEGMATMGLHGQNYNTYMYEADKAANEAKRLQNEMAKDPYDTELEERYREMISLQQEYILSAQQEKESIRDLVSDGMELELDALQELIDKKNEALESERDLYEYQKKVKEQTSEIASLEKQMAAYNGDDSEETKQKIQQIKVDLESARQDLQETEYDKYISDQQQLLDELYLSYEEILNTRLDNLNALVADVIAQINADANSISATLSEKAEDVGYTLSESMKSIWDTNADGTNDIITTYCEEFTKAQTTTNDALGVINTNLQNMITQLNKLAKTDVKSAGISSVANSDEADTPKTEPAKEEKQNVSTPTIKVGGKINAGSAPIYDYAGDKSGETQYFKKDPIYKVLDEKNGYLKVRWHKLSKGVTGWFKKSDVKAYATGKKNFLEDEIAWTQEKGQEFIVRPSDGAILTPVAKGDSVLTSAASNNIWDMANSPAEFIKNNLGLDKTNVPNGANVNNSVTQNFENITFSMPNVHSYNELVSEMQRDPKFEKLILAMTVDQIAGKSKLAKNKAIR